MSKPTPPASGVIAALIAQVFMFVAAHPAAGQFVEPVDQLFSMDGEVAGDNFGFINRVVGDVDGDGVGDIGVGVPNSDQAGTNGGKAYLISGATGKLIRAHLGSANDYLGYEMGGVGDLNNDGHDEYVIGAPETINFQTTFGNGRAFVFNGANGSVLHAWTGESSADGFGGQCAGAGSTVDGGVGDINNDGVPDILIGAPTYGLGGLPLGRAYVYSGATFAPILVKTGHAGIDLFGFGIAGLGDLNGDGHGEFVVGAPNAGTGDRGLAYVYDGKTGDELDFSPLGPDATGGFFGFLFATGPGDVDGDGVNDIAVADLQDTEGGAGAGKFYVFSGVDGASIHTFIGGPNDGLGVGRGCGDVNFDGHADLLISAFTSSAGAANAGRTFVFSGADGGILRTITNTVAEDQFGFSTVGLASDLNGDGGLDFAISAPFHDAAGEDSGRVYAIAGDILPCVADVTGDGQVGVADLEAVILAWGTDDADADVNGDGIVGVDDLVDVILAWGDCP